jgi:general secretion pathway protein C
LALSAQQLALAKTWHDLEAWLQTLPLRTIKQALCGVLVVWLLYGLAQLCWLLFIEPDSQEALPQVAVSTSKGQAAVVDVTALQALQLFGEAGKQQAAVVEVKTVAEGIEDQARKTSLDIQLQGIVYSDEPELGVAMIVVKGKSDQYHIGDKLPLSPRVALAKVLVDRVIIDNSGRYESLWLYEENEKPRVSSNRAKPVDAAKLNDLRGKKDATELARDYRSRLYKNPSSLAEVVRISPAQVDVQMVGYRVSPGRDKEQFKAFGFKAGDVVTSINSVSLDDPSKALEVYKMMRTAREASFTVDRGGESIQLMVSLDGA